MYPKIPKTRINTPNARSLTLILDLKNLFSPYKHL
jgi:hypothetical protein